VGSTRYGLAEIKTEVYAIEQAVNSTRYGLAEIKTEVYQIQQTLNSIITHTFECPTQVTSGPFLVSKNGGDLFVSVLNNRNATSNLYNVRVYDLSHTPKQILTVGTLTYNVSFTLAGLSATNIHFNQNLSKDDFLEIQVLNIDCNTKVSSEIAQSAGAADIYNIFNSSDYKAV
jgi:hypothetical protein